MLSEVPLIQKVKICIEQIYTYDYWVAEWEKVKHKKPLSDCTREELLGPFQLFWESLPDNKACRRTPFMLVCDLAEEFCFGGDSEDQNGP